MQRRVTLHIRYIGNYTGKDIVPAHNYDVDINIPMSNNEHPELSRIRIEEAAKVLYASRLVNKYMNENSPTGELLRSTEFRLDFEVLAVKHLQEFVHEPQGRRRSTD